MQIRQIVLGAITGVLATLPMTFVMEFMYEKLPAQPSGPLPPRTLTLLILEKLGLRKIMSEAQKKVAIWVAHFGFGGAMGILYPFLDPLCELPVILTGSIFGIFIWLLNYQFIIPGTELMPPALRQSRRRNLIMISSHLVWGISAVYVYKLVLS